MILTVWSVLRTILFIELDPESFDLMFSDAMGDAYNRQFIAVLLFFFLALDLVFRVCVGRSALREGRGKRCGFFYLFFDLVFLAGAVYNIFHYFTSDIYASSSGLRTSLIFELTSLYTSADLLYSSVKVKTLRKKLKKEGEANAD